MTVRVRVLGSHLDLDASFVEATPQAIRERVRAYERGDTCAPDDERAAEPRPDQRRAFDLALSLPDSFLGDVMAELRTIPYGETRTYGEVADRLDTAPVAVGGACARNPLPLVVPCHRVLRSDGGLGGYSAPDGVALKRRLLAHEREHAAEVAP